MKLEKLFVARHQIEAAIQLHVERRDFISAITLAGAGEEIIGKLLAPQGLESAQDELVASLISKYVPSMPPKELRDNYLNKTKNALKHLGDANQSFIEIEPEIESIGWLARAITNYLKIQRDITPPMRSFLEYLDNPHLDLAQG